MRPDDEFLLGFLLVIIKKERCVERKASLCVEAVDPLLLITADTESH